MGDFFAWSLTAGDVDNDDHADLVIGAPQEAPGSEPRSGYVFIYKGDVPEMRPWMGLAQE